MLDSFALAQFRNGVALLTSHSYANTTTTDLWDSLEHASGVPVRVAMDNGFSRVVRPVVAVEATSEGISLKQSRFGYSSVDPTSWHIPIIIRAQVVPNRSRNGFCWRATKKNDLENTSMGCGECGDTPYRVTYGEDLLRALSKARRYRLRTLRVDDTWSSVLAGETDAETHLSLRAWLRN